jgi:hypothetical protein
MNAAAIIFAAAAFLVSCASLYLSSLARADIDVYHVPDLDQFSPGVFRGDEMLSSTLSLTLFITNEGARAGLLEILRFENLDTKSAPPWGIVQYTSPQSVSSSGARFGPYALRAGETKAILLNAELRVVDLPAEEQAKRVGALQGLSAVVTWSFFRASGRLGTLVPSRFRRARVRATRSFRIAISATEYRDAVIDMWRSRKESEYLADIAEHWESAS